MRAFLEDFGLSCFEAGGRLYGKGSDGRPFVHVTEPGEARFLAIGFRAETLADLYQKIADAGRHMAAIGAVFYEGFSHSAGAPVELHYGT